MTIAGYLPFARARGLAEIRQGAVRGSSLDESLFETDLGEWRSAWNLELALREQWVY